MSANPQVEEMVALPLAEAPPAVEPANGHAAVAVATPARKRRPPWVGSLAVGAVALIASGTLGYVSYSTAQERNATRAELVATQGDLKEAQNKLEVANADAATRLITARYVGLYTRDQGRVQTDYHSFLRCTTFGACRTSAQNLVNDIAQFQSDRKAANVPSELVGADRDLGDALSSAYAAAAQIVSAMDNANMSRFTAGIKKLEAAMLALGKVEFAIGGRLSL